MTFQSDVSLTNCDREPIHQLGAIQGFGCLMAFNLDWKLAHRSVNVCDICPLVDHPPIGTSARSIFAGKALERLRQATSRLTEADDIERLFGVNAFGGRDLFDVAIHIVDDLVIIELEPHSDDAIDQGLALIRQAGSRLEKHTSSSAMFERAVAQLRDMLGYDRVMLYRFASDQSGEVIAEEADGKLESFLGLRFPAFDIPQQARKLFVRNRFRIIADMAGTAIPIEPSRTIQGEPLDLSMSVLRSHSAMHVEYMKNMGVGASLAIAIVVRGELWGMFACHHYERRVLPYSLRTLAELFSDLFSLALERQLAAEALELEQRGRKLHDRVARNFIEGSSIAVNLASLRPIINDVIPHSGLSLYVEEGYFGHGSSPTEPEFLKLIPAINDGSTGRVFTTQNLSKSIEVAAAFSDRAVGALVVPVSRRPGDYLVLWRKELTQTVTWAGNPAKNIKHGPNGARLTPRQSFAAWTDTVKGCSAPWTEKEVKLAESLRMSLLEVILKLTEEAMQLRLKSQQQQDLLITELNHRVRNILNLIRGVINQSQHGAEDIESFSKIIGGRINALSTAHDNITRKNWTSASLYELINAEADAYLMGKTDRVTIEGSDVLISPEAYTALALVMHEMVTNSVKYGALCDRRGKLTIRVKPDDKGLLIEWRETDGPTVKPPTRRGFGSTIIEQSIAFELSGTTSLRFASHGVEADFWIPENYVTLPEPNSQPHSAVGSRKATVSKAETPATRPQAMLVVEDSMIIALDTQDRLTRLEIGQVDVESSVAGALAQIGQVRYQLALLDFNLGSETSEAVARELTRRAIPFWVASGYGDSEEMRSLGAEGILVKPYGREELEEMLDEYARLDKPAVH